MLRQSANRHSSKEISELLESDDELPDSYDEEPDIPAYQNDSRFERFEPINYEWLHQKIENDRVPAQLHKEQYTLQQLQEMPQCVTNEIIPKHNMEVKKNKREILISKGILTKLDIFYIKSIEEYATETTLLWFVDFLNLRCVQPNQRSCLVKDSITDYCKVAKTPLYHFNKRYYFKLVIS